MDGRRRRGRAGVAGAARERVVLQLRRARPVPRAALTPGTVVWARIPYRDQPDSSKSRPAVVVAVTGRAVCLLPVTSSTKPSVRQSPRYVALCDWATAGLNRPCLVALLPVVVDIIDVTTVAGTLVPADAARVLEAARPRLAPGSGDEGPAEPPR